MRIRGFFALLPILVVVLTAGCDLEFGMCATDGPTSPTRAGCPIENPVEHNFVFADDLAKEDISVTYENLRSISPEPNANIAVLGIDGLVPFSYSVKIRMKEIPQDPNFSGIVSAWTSGDGWQEIQEIGSSIIKPGQEIVLPQKPARVSSSFKYVRIRLVSDRKSGDTREGRKIVTSLAWLYTGYTWSVPGNAPLPFQ